MPQLVLERFIEIARYLLDGRTRTIVELGARNGAESLSFHSAFPAARIVAFECNPATLPACRAALSGIPEITLIEKAVTDRAGEISFYPTDPQRTITKEPDGNPGASSIFRARTDYPHETYVQNEIRVQSTTLAAVLAEQKIDSVDLLWMDIQGAELLALKGMGERLGNVRLMHLEVEFRPIYEGQPLFPEVHSFLRERGFQLLGFTSYSRYAADAVYAKRGVASALTRIALYRRFPFLLRLQARRARHRLKGWLGLERGRPARQN